MNADPALSTVEESTMQENEEVLHMALFVKYRKPWLSIAFKI